MSNLNLNHWHISRREALRGLGATIALPFLNAMLPASARAADVAAKPKRSVFLYIPNGVNTLTWQIEQAGAAYQFTKPLASLEKHRADITPISGLHHPMVLGKHHNCEKVWLTGANVPGDGGSFRNTVSADQLIAEVHGAATRFSSLEMAVEGQSLAWSKDGIQIPAERNTQQIFNALFGVERDSKETIRRRLSRRGSILDLVADDAKRVNNKLGSEDRSKLDEYLTAVRQVEERTRRADEWLNVAKPVVPADEAARLQRKLSMAEAGAYYRLFYDLMVMALRTDSTRVITCGIGSEAQGGAIPDIGILQQRHGLSHHNGDPEQLRRLTEADTFLVGQFSYFLDQLKEHKESDTPLLDTTQVLWGSGMAYGHSHGNANLPTILAGGKALGYKHGTHVDFNLPKIGKYNVADATAHYQICSRPVDSDARVSNLLLTMLQRADVKVDKFQDSIGPISQIVA
ncbi:MAG: DUF1552 domain-containing protein [Prosthecobacter sp.]|jgi:hypothetical protein|uniref:DUF1552 domain-containing protein n=1 Tax=Prosthecobacter sp. TaxID=1965333 RepID=UPI0026213E57|nr:DUF1552 domain-containing protein [Prosthecobacter sp.]MCF7790299.1 DUF1552 domain-containing protein [Prosthecobacter sp.]